MSNDKCKTCESAGHVDPDGKPICFDCPEFSSSDFLDDIVKVVAEGDVDPGDHDILTEYGKFKEHPTPHRDPLDSLSWLDKKALWITNRVGTMWFAIFCAIMVTVPLIFPATMPVIQYVSSGYLQLILLPLIMVGQNLQGIHAEIRSQNNYELAIRTNLELQQVRHEIEHIRQILTQGTYLEEK